jgi:cyclopropane fatty-acyl-phospholipid synthase-like methyltransferase
MKNRYSILFLFCLLSAALTAQQRYRIAPGDPNGIEKWYMGRQIAYVMSHYGISWLERPERQEEENTELLLRNLALKDGMQVADIGAGSGYHSLRIAGKIGSGRVFAVDVSPEMVDHLKDRLKRSSVRNISCVLGSEQDIPLKDRSIDLMLMVDVYHEFSFPYEMVQAMRRVLKDDGRIYLVEFRGEDPSVPIKKVHKMTEAQAVREFEAAGFELERNIGNLPWQHCMVFRKKPAK